MTPAFLAAAFTTLAYFVVDGMSIPVTPLFRAAPATDRLLIGLPPVT